MYGVEIYLFIFMVGRIEMALGVETVALTILYIVICPRKFLHLIDKTFAIKM